MVNGLNNIKFRNIQATYQETQSFDTYALIKHYQFLFSCKEKTRL